MSYLFSLTGTGNDDTALIQAAFDDLRASGGILELQGQFNVSKLNFTNNHTVSIRGLGVGCTILHPLETVNAVIDMSGSYFMELSDLRIGMPENLATPNVGILLGQVPSLQSNWIGFNRVFVDGTYQVAALYVFGVASSEGAGQCAFWNRQPGHYSVILCSDNFADVVSDYTMLSTTGPMSDWKFSKWEIHSYTGQDTPGYALYLRGARQIEFEGGNMSASGSELITCATGTDGQECADLKFDSQTYYVEPGQPLFGYVMNPIHHINKVAFCNSCNQSGALITNPSNITDLVIQ